MAANKYVPAVLKALSFQRRSVHDLQQIPRSAWPALLETLDRAHLTLALGARCRDSLPESVRARIDRNLACNAVRHERLVEAQSEIAAHLSASDIPFMVMKGLSQWPWYSDDQRERPQYDIDIYVPGESMAAAVEGLRELRYEAVSDRPDPGADHLPVMIRRTGWKWRGDYYDPDMPPSVELHFRFWDPQRMRFGLGDVARFWRGHTIRDAGGLRFPALDPVDGLSYSAMHLVRHLLGGDLHLRHVYEIAHFLDRSARNSIDDSFWERWGKTGLQSCRIVEGIAFRLAREWFDCNLHPAAQAAIDGLPPTIGRWFSLFAKVPCLSTDSPDKNEIWLHSCLVSRTRDRCGIAMRRLFPTRGSRVVLDPHAPAADPDKRIAFEASFLANRAIHHLRTIPPTLHGAYLWCSRGNGPA